MNTHVRFFDDVAQVAKKREGFKGRAAQLIFGYTSLCAASNF